MALGILKDSVVLQVAAKSVLYFALLILCFLLAPDSPQIFIYTEF